MIVKHGVIYNKFCSTQKKDVYERCAIFINSRCVVYKGDPRVFIDASYGDTLDYIIQNINSIVAGFFEDFEELEESFTDISNRLTYYEGEVDKVDTKVEDLTTKASTITQNVNEFLDTFCSRVIDCLGTMYTYKWVGKNNDITCITEGEPLENTGYLRYNNLYKVTDTGTERALDKNNNLTSETGLPQHTKPNAIGTEGYIENVYNITLCPLAQTEGDIIYYGEASVKPNNSTIVGGLRHDTNDGNSFTTKVDTIGHYIAIPAGVIIDSIENSGVPFKGDFLYNLEAEKDYYTKESITIEGEPYTLWYCEFYIPFQAGIEVTTRN